jgi:DNA polymerase-3 subunit gamma/tau
LSSYLVLARKYRPKQFSDIVGQLSVVKTLVNAIKLNRTHQAYVFSGSRGIGKTSIARIFSKALRCENRVERDGLLYSCDHCADCIEIAAGNSVNVMEIDGASNNGVDSVREIREGAKFLPSSGNYKIYIIDEVHMLSTAAFNALLKTLEEPPEHVVFIFATTESHKIPETILGRCQRFDFKRVTVAQITERMKEVLGSEKIEFEDAALNLIARAAEGSMRDALSILDQVISFSGMKITAQAVRESVGLIGTELVLALVSKVIARDAKGALGIAQQAFNQGVDLKVLLKMVIEMVHALILIQVGVEKPETHFNDDELAQIAAMKSMRPLEENEMIFQVFHHGLEMLSKAAQPKLIFDLLIVKTSLAEALMKLSADEEEDFDGVNEDADDDDDLKRRATPAPMDRGSPRPSAPAEVVTPISAQPQAPQSQPAMNAPNMAMPAMAPSAPSIAHSASAAPEKPAPRELFGGMRFGAKKQPEAIVIEEKPSTTPIQSGRPKTWEGFIELCFEVKPMLAIILESVVEWAVPEKDGDNLKLGFRERDQVKAEQLQQKVFRDQFAQLIEAHFGTKSTIEIFFSKHQGESMAEKSLRLKREARDAKMSSILTNHIIQEAKALFGGELHIELSDKDK